MRHLPLWSLLVVPGYLLALGLAALLPGRFDEVLISDLIMLFFYLSLGGWILVTIRSMKLDVRQLVGPRPADFRWWSLVTVPAAVLTFSIGASVIFFHLLAVVSPQIVDRLMGETTLDIRTPHASLPTLHAVMIVVVMVVLAPVTEEVIFRGLMLHRFTVKWGIVRALLWSSFIFGICHVNPIGLFVFAMVLSVLYVRTRSLLVTIAYHALNNTVGLLLTLFTNQSSSSALADLRAYIVPAIVITLISGAFILRLLTRYWPQTWQDLPYFRRDGVVQGADSAGDTGAT